MTKARLQCRLRMKSTKEVGFFNLIRTLLDTKIDPPKRDSPGLAQLTDDHSKA